MLQITKKRMVRQFGSVVTVKETSANTILQSEVEGEIPCEGPARPMHRAETECILMEPEDREAWMMCARHVFVMD